MVNFFVYKADSLSELARLILLNILLTVLPTGTQHVDKHVNKKLSTF